MTDIKIDSTINILGGMPDLQLINYFLLEHDSKQEHFQFTDIRSQKSVQRFKKAIKDGFITGNSKIDELTRTYLFNKNINENRYLLFLILSVNNSLFNSLNENVFFPVYYSGRKLIKKEEVLVCLKDLTKRNQDLAKWGDYTLELTASKYLTLLKKFGLMEGVAKKEIVYQNLNLEEFTLFIYCIAEFDKSPNKLKSEWLPYSFLEKEFLLKMVLDKKRMKFIDLTYASENLKYKTLIEYSQLYDTFKSL